MVVGWWGCPGCNARQLRSTFTAQQRIGSGEKVSEKVVLLDEMCAEVAELNEDYFVMRFYRNLDPTQPLAGRAYAFPAEALTKIKYVQAKLDGWRGSQRISSGLNGTRCASAKQPMALTPKAAAAAQKSGAKRRSTALRAIVTKAPPAP